MADPRCDVSILGLVVVLAASPSVILAEGSSTADPSSSDPAPTAGAGVAAGVLDFRIVDAEGAPIPGRLTFVGTDGTREDLFPNAGARPDDLAVRKNVVYTLSGRARITVPAGEYTVYASRGIEWSLAERTLSFAEGRTTQWTAELNHEVDTTGWISGDFHLHTLTYSGHGDSNMKERIISIVGEGVEFAVATDHNHNTDYQPTIDHLHAGPALTAVTGNEVSVPVGHFNAFPLDPARAPVDPALRDANELFGLLRAETNSFDIVPVIQVNHPRWNGIDYFEIAGLDPVDGTSASPRYSMDFDTIEVFNENAGWGYYRSFLDGVPTSSNVQSVLEDWYNLLNRGHRYAAVGNSDSHTVHYAFAGYPRNYVTSPTDEPAAIDPVDVATALRERAVFTTIGPFVDFRVNGTQVGGDAVATAGTVDLAIRVQAASWIDCDRVKVVMNGDVVATIDVPETDMAETDDSDARNIERLNLWRTLTVPHDCWIALLVEGDDPLAPIVEGGERDIRPLAVVNPVWVDADGDGWTGPWERAIRTVAASQAELASRRSITTPARDRGLRMLAAVETARPFASSLVRDGLADRDRGVRLRAARCAERLGDPSLLDAVRGAFRNEDGDPYLRVALLRAIGTLDPETMTATLVTFLIDHGADLPTTYRRELADLLPGTYVEDWYAIGYFPAAEAGSVRQSAFGPEDDADVAREYTGKDGTTARWRRLSTNASGFLNLLELADDPAHARYAGACAQTWLYTAEDRDVAIALGTDDGSRVYLNDELVYDNPRRRGANPLEHLATWRLRRGWNRVLFKIENGTGGFGAYFRVLDDAVRSAAKPEA